MRIIEINKIENSSHFLLQVWEDWSRSIRLSIIFFSYLPAYIKYGAWGSPWRIDLLVSDRFVFNWKILKKDVK